MTKYVRIAVLILLVAALLPASAVIGSAQGKVVVRVTNWAGVDEAAEFQVIVDAVNAASETFEVVYEPKPDNYYTQLQTALAGETAPDLFWLDQDHMAWAYEGVLLDISDYMAADTREVARADDYFPGVWQTVALADGVYGLPWIAQPVVLYYNRDIFDAMGVEYPTAEWTWDQFREAAVTLTTADHYGFTLNGWPPIHMFIWSFGGEVISADLKTSPIDTPEAMAGAAFYAGMIWNEECCPSEQTVAEQGFGEMFKAGKVAMFMGGAADDLDRVEGLNVGVSPVPKGATGENVTFAWTAATVINAKSEHPDEAYEAGALTEGIHHWKIVSAAFPGDRRAPVASEPRKAANAEAILEAVPCHAPSTSSPALASGAPSSGDLQAPLFAGEDTVENPVADARILLRTLPK